MLLLQVLQVMQPEVPAGHQPVSAPKVSTGADASCAVHASLTGVVCKEGDEQPTAVVPRRHTPPVKRLGGVCRRGHSGLPNTACLPA